MSKGKTTTTAEIPAYIQQQQQEVFEAARGLAGQPFVPYTGPRVAGFSPDQLRQFEATRQLTEEALGYQPLAGIAELAEAPTPGLLGADIAAYQSPFQEQVIETALGDIQRQQELAQQRAQAQAIGAGAFGGARSAILEAEAQRPYIEQAARTAAGLRQAGFEQAQRAAEADIAREMAGRQFRAGLLGGIQQQQLGRLGALGQIGEQQRLLQQQALEVPYQEFQRALAYGPQQFGLLQAGQPGSVPISQTVSRGTGLGDVLGGLTGLASTALLAGINPFAGLLGGGAASAGAGMGGGITGFLPGGMRLV